jgi:hypothetical protein
MKEGWEEKEGRSKEVRIELRKEGKEEEEREIGGGGENGTKGSNQENKEGRKHMNEGSKHYEGIKKSATKEGRKLLRKEESYGSRCEGRREGRYDGRKGIPMVLRCKCWGYNSFVNFAY